MAKLYITNKHGYYFEVSDCINVDNLVDCKVHNSLEDMYSFVCDFCGLELDEVEHSELNIFNDGGTWFGTTLNGMVFMLKESPEDYINNFTL